MFEIWILLKVFEFEYFTDFRRRSNILKLVFEYTRMRHTEYWNVGAEYGWKLGDTTDDDDDNNDDTAGRGLIWSIITIYPSNCYWSKLTVWHIRIISVITDAGLNKAWHTKREQQPQHQQQQQQASISSNESTPKCHLNGIMSLAPDRWTIAAIQDLIPFRDLERFALPN